MKKIALFLLFFAFLFVTACSVEQVDETLKIQYSYTEFTIGVGEEKDLELPIDVNLSVPLNDVIEEKDGIIKGLKEGEVVLTLILIADSNVTKEVKIVVTETVYTITYDLDGGVCEDLVTEFRSYKDVVLKTPSKEGYAFDGWYEGKTRLEGLQENKDYTFSIGGSKGILSTGTRTFSKGVFKQRCFKVERFKCLTCGTEWESDPYEY